MHFVFNNNIICCIKKYKLADVISIVCNCEWELKQKLLLILSIEFNDYFKQLEIYDMYYFHFK